MNETRIVSLVPSITESLFDIDLGDRVIGVTDYCVRPADKVAQIPKVGGTKDVRVKDVIDLRPDLVIANREENTRAVVEVLQAAGLTVWVTYPETVRDSLDLLWELVRRFNKPLQGHRLAALEKACEWAAAAAENARPTRVFCPIWRSDDWWMTISGRTYVSDLLRVCGGENVFSSLAGQKGETRYPRVGLADILAARPEVILLPSEPYAFGQSDAEFWLAQPDLPAALNNRVHLVDGSLLTWHGTRLAKALQEIPVLLAAESD